MPKTISSRAPGLSRRAAVLAAAASVALIAAGCATPQPPTAQINATAAAVAHAAGSGGDEYASQQMQSARNKLQRANAAVAAKDYPSALALSREALVDAQLAEAKAESTKARQGAEAARESNRVLREEIQRKSQ
jgi:lipoprotein-anchoring transpeptidase ErfK/SrfK